MWNYKNERSHPHTNQPRMTSSKIQPSLVKLLKLTIKENILCASRPKRRYSATKVKSYCHHIDTNTLCQEKREVTYLRLKEWKCKVREVSVWHASDLPDIDSPCDWKYLRVQLLDLVTYCERWVHISLESLPASVS